MQAMKPKSESKAYDYPHDLVNHSSHNLGEHILTSLNKYKVCMIHNVPHHMRDIIQNLMGAGNRFINSYYNDSLRDHTFNHSKGFIDPYGCKGFFPAKEYFANCNNGDRIFFEVIQNSNGNNFISNKYLPCLDEDKNQLTDDILKFSSFTQDLVKITLEAIEKNLNLEKMSLQKKITNKCSINMTRYHPITQARLLKLFKDKRLHVLKRNPITIRQFEPHTDICPVTILCYPNGNFSGVEGMYNGTFKPFHIPDNSQGPVFLLFTGQQLEVLSNGHIQPLTHQVTTTARDQIFEAERKPDNLRFVLGHFSFYNDQIIGPAITKEGTPIKPFTNTSFPYVNTADAVWSHDKEIYSSPEEQLDDHILQAFPMHSVFEKEIVS